MKEALQQLSDAMDSIGHPIYSDEFLGRVLAWTCLSGFCEPTVLNPALNAVIGIAQKRFNIMGGCVPAIDKMNTYWRPAMEELVAHGAKTVWLAPMMERYGITGWEKLDYTEWAKEFNVKPPQRLDQMPLL